jgi:REP element-mobilizing transposase RayT
LARPLRIEYEGAFYHVTARGNERKRIFFGKGDYDKFKEYLLDAQDKYGYPLHMSQDKDLRKTVEKITISMSNVNA